MSIKTKVVAAAAALTVAGGLSTAGTLPVSAATTQCGSACIQIFSAKFGTYTNPGFIESVFLGNPVAGVPTILHRASSSDPTGDFIVPQKAPVSTFYAEGMVSAAVNAHYETETAVQVEYAPYGHATGMCAAVATAAYQNEGLSLQPCSTPGTTVFIIDFADAPAAKPYFPIVNASTTDFTHPFTMTIHGNPADKPFPQITLQHMHGNPAHVPDNQLWSTAQGPAN
jgi:hypothetical protein